MFIELNKMQILRVDNIDIKDFSIIENIIDPKKLLTL